MLDKYRIKQELNRKLIHIFYSTSIACTLWYFSKEVVLPWFVFIAIALPLLDYGRQHIPILRLPFIYIFSSVIRPIEYRVITGASWVVIGAAVTTLLFNEMAAIIGILVLSVSDSMAAVIGVKFGKTRLFNKSPGRNRCIFFFPRHLLYIYFLLHYFS